MKKDDKIINLTSKNTAKKTRQKSKEDQKIEIIVKDILEDYKKYKALIDLNVNKKYISMESLCNKFDNLSFFILGVETSLQLLNKNLFDLVQIKVFSNKQVQEQIEELNISPSTYYTNWTKACKELLNHFNYFQICSVKNVIDK